MNKEFNLDKDDEKIKYDANEKLLESKSFFIFTITEDGNFDAICSCEKLNKAEYIGLLAYINAVSAQKLDDSTVIVSNQDLDDDEEDL